MSRFSVSLVALAAVLVASSFVHFPLWTSLVVGWLLVVSVTLRALAIATRS